MRSILVVIVFALYGCVVLGQPGPASDDFAISPDEIIERAGSVARISCLYKSDTSREVFWGVEKFGTSAILFPDNRTNNIFLSADKKTLIFNPVSQGQEGNYYCWIPITQTRNVFSKLVPFTILRPPVITNRDKPNGEIIFNYNLTVRTPAKLNLSTFGTPNPELTLYKKTGGKYVIFTSERFNVTLIGITISSVEPEDEGEYRLTATYEIYPDDEEFTIIVNIPPVAPRLALEVLNGTATDESVTRVLAIIGTSVAISCKMTEAYTGGNLQVFWAANNNYTVKKSNTEVQLVIDSVDEKHEQQYACHAVNKINSTMISVDLDVGSVPNPFKITVSSNNNTLIVVWEKNDTASNYEGIIAHYVQYRSVNGSDQNIAVVKFAASVRTATFRSVERGVEYLVSMWSENLFGNSSTSNEVSVVVADDFAINPDEIIERAGSVARISCLYKPDTSRQVFWGVEKSGTSSILFPDNTTNNIFASPDQKTLIFNPVSQSQEGNYYCWIPLTRTMNLYSKLIPFTILHGTVMGDPHFMVPLLSNDILCYSIQGYPELAFNLIYNEDFIINAVFVDSTNDEKEATWIGKLAVIPRHANKSDAVIFDSVKQEVVLVDRGHFKASVVNKISYDERGKMSVKFTPGITKQAGNPIVHVKYEKPLASFDVTFHGNHLDVNWDLKYDTVPKIHGLMGQFMVKGMVVDPIKKILTYPDGRDPVPVKIDNVMTGKKCWKAMNPGHQGERLIKGSILDYMVSNLLTDDFKLKNF